MIEADIPIMLRDECLVRLEKPERVTVSKLLIIPDSAKREEYELYQATILAAGPGRRLNTGERNPVEVKVGDRVLCYWASMECKPTRRWTEDGIELRIVSEWQMMAVLDV